ncbi:alanine racemase [Actinomycetospora sp. NBRC 106375]|uniref:alanine racemase n=1 Tax=Actinomycetospora sp. NBRC 106375 TaxID=3032207 RepID=UPI0024A23F80|nr:alanine racemase [Actinomycetospora sp. NBRC 106375]GLZ44595.1 alanine racemase [Actinomycetospora sp. NBRC 106375]
MTRPRAEAHVDHDALAHNVGLLAGLARASGAATMAVVKADGYGHGAVDVARTALASGATWLGVCTLDEAAELRAAGVGAPVLSWLHLPDEDFAPAVADEVDLGVSSRAELDGVAAGARRAGRPARIHLKIDTGLSRNGCPPAAWGDLLAAVEDARAAGDVEVAAVWSHLAHADAPAHPTIDVQSKRLDDAWRAAAETLGGPRPWRHLANSAATLTRPDLHLDLVRPGIAVYGLDPLDAPDRHGLRPAMTFRTRLALVKRVAAGEGVSYGHEWTAPDDRVLALVPTGYADGVPRRLGGTMTVQLADRRRPVVGRVCMDQVVVDLGPADGDVPAVSPGDEVVLFGPGDDGEPTASEWAGWLDTIHYEVVTGVGCRPRVTRTRS